MINQKELRIGNLVNVQLNYDEVSYDKCEVEQITDKHLHHSLPTGGGTVTQWDKVEPIDLDNNWFMAFGFIYKDGASEYGEQRKNKVHIYVHDEDPGFFHFSRGMFDGKKHEIKYVHQLQNLYFALTGDELVLQE